MNFKNNIINELNKISKEVILEIPPKLEMGDFAFPCFQLSKELKKNPNEVAKDLASKLKIDGIEEIKSIGPYVNFFIDKEKLTEKVLKNIFENKFNVKISDEKIIIEYPSPNTNKPIHLGHLRNIFLGSSITKILKKTGFEVKKINLLNDRGIHICKSMVAYKLFGNNEEPDIKSDHFVGKYYVLFSNMAKENPKLEQKAQELLKKWENGDEETIKLWRKMNNWAEKGFNETFEKLGLKYDKVYYESEFYDKAHEVIEEGLRKKIFYKDKDTGAIMAELEKYNLPNKVLLRSNGTAIYMTQDIYLAILKQKDFKYDQSIYVVGNEQNMHFKQLFKILELLGFKWAEKCYHLSYGLVYLPHGRMKSREGEVIDADNIIEEVESLAKVEIIKRHQDLSDKEVNKRSNMIGLGALKFMLLKLDPVKDMIFNPKESVSFEGETGPYIQYTYARCSSIIRKANKKIELNVDLNLIKNEEIIRLMDKYGEIILDSSKYKKPSIIAHYLIMLAQTFNEFYHKNKVITENEELTKARLLLVYSVKEVIKSGLELLDIESPEEM